MHNLRRGFRNVWRSKMRTAIVALLVGVALSLGVTMMAIDAAVAGQLASVEQSVGTELEIRPVGSFGGFGRGEPLMMEVLEATKDIPALVQVSPVIVYQSMPRMGAPGSQVAIEEIMRQRMAVMGIVPGQSLRVFGGGVAELIEGRNFTSDDEGKNVAIVGVDYATQNELALGGLLLIDETEYEIIGISQGEHRFANTTVFLVFSTAQVAFGMEDQMSQVYLQVDTLSNVEPTLALLRDALGDKADVVSQAEATLSTVAQSMDMVRGTTSVGLWLAVATGGLVILFTMLLTVRERQKEIGVLKAIGSGNGDLLFGFAWESVVLSVVGALVGVILFATAGQYLASTLMSSIIPESAVTQGTVNPGLPGGTAGQVTGSGGRGMFPGAGGFSGFAIAGGSIYSQLGDISVSFSLGLLAKLLIMALGLGLLGGLLPALYALRLRPAEVLRNE